jgi:hypothetical protein
MSNSKCAFPVAEAGRVTLAARLLTLGSEAQLQMLEAAATIDLIESKVLSLLGELAVLFLPEPQSGFTNGLSVRSRLHWWIAARCTGPSCSP